MNYNKDKILLIKDKYLFNDTTDNGKIFRDKKHIEEIVVDCTDWNPIDNQYYIIHESMFENCSQLKKITFENSDRIKFIRIGKFAFRNCEKLEQVIFLAGTSSISPMGLSHIGEGAFQGCKKLVSFPNVASTENIIIEKNAFYECTSLPTVVINASKEKSIYIDIGERAFYNCNNLVSVHIGFSIINTIGSYAFANCYRLKNLDVTESKIYHIGEKAFNKCSELTNLKLFFSESQDNNKVEIAEETFSSCNSLKTIEISVFNREDTNNHKNTETNNYSHEIIFGSNVFRSHLDSLLPLEYITLNIHCDETAYENIYFEECVFYNFQKLKRVDIFFPKSLPRGYYIWLKENSLYGCEKLLFNGKNILKIFNLGKDTDLPNYKKNDVFLIAENAFIEKRR